MIRIGIRKVASEAGIPLAYLAYDARRGRIPARRDGKEWTLDVHDALAIAENPQVYLAWRRQLESTRRRWVEYDGHLYTSVTDLARAIGRSRQTVYMMLHGGEARYTHGVTWHDFLAAIKREKPT